MCETACPSYPKSYGYDVLLPVELGRPGVIVKPVNVTGHASIHGVFRMSTMRLTRLLLNNSASCARYPLREVSARDIRLSNRKSFFN